MNGIQKVIKIFAICLAVFIIVNICGWIIGGITFISRIGENRDRDNYEERADEKLEYHQENISQNINEIDIDIRSAILTLETNKDEFSVQIDDKSNFSVVEQNGKLKIREDSSWFWNNERAEKVIVNVPKNVKLKELNIDAGGGKITINGIKAEDFKIDEGAGLLEIENSEFDKIHIEGGAGEIRINSSLLNNLKLDAGVGKVDINSKITGNSKIECGIGQISLKLEGEKEEYKINAEKGIGSIKIDGTEQGNNAIFGNGNNTIKIERRNW